MGKQINNAKIRGIWVKWSDNIPGLTVECIVCGADRPDDCITLSDGPYCEDCYDDLALMGGQNVG